ncbi:hypothetical protein ACP70R_001056 [Stipagrostis hirtigluma subsp. patula]
MVVFVANPNKHRDIIQVLVYNHRDLLKLLHNLPTSKGEDEQLDEEKDLIIKETEKLVQSEQARCRWSTIHHWLPRRCYS